MKKNYLLLITAVLLMAVGCQPPTADTNTNANISINENMNSTNMNAMNSNANMMNSNMDESSSVIESKEPEKYQAKVTMKFEAVGEEKAAQLPTLTAMVVRDGDNRKFEINTPNNQNFAYIDTVDKNVLVMPSRKQYANINRNSVGFDMRRLMTPENIIKNIKQLKGVTKVGEEKFNGRDAMKYKYDSLTNTGTKAGDVETSSYIYVDKETGLPLHTETLLASQNKQVQGFNGIKVKTDISDIKTDVSEDMFAVPTDYKEVDEAQIRGQIDLIFKAAMAVIQQLMQSVQPTAQPQNNGGNSNNTF